MRPPRNKLDDVNKLQQLPLRQFIRELQLLFQKVMGLRAGEGSFVVNSNALLEEAERENCVACWWCLANVFVCIRSQVGTVLLCRYSSSSLWSAEMTGAHNLAQLAFVNPYYVLGTQYKTEK